MALEKIKTIPFEASLEERSVFNELPPLLKIYFHYSTGSCIDIWIESRFMMTLVTLF